jgi:hypothetical protein
MVPSAISGVRLTSNSISAARRSFARASTGLSLGAASSAASAARSRLQTRQKWPSAELVQVAGSRVGSPSAWLALTPQPSQVHFLALI